MHTAEFDLFATHRMPTSPLSRRANGKNIHLD
jgi:hypothetical protein